MGSETDYDFIVVGSGPAGAAAAGTAAEHGFRTLLLEKESLRPNGRYKPCGGAMDWELVRAVDLPEDIIERHVENLVLHHIGHETFEKRGKGAVVWRSKFDKYLTTIAENRGAEIRDNEPVVAIATIDEKTDPFGDGYNYTLHTPKNNYRARIVIAADGVTSRVLRILNWPNFPAEDLVLTITKEMKLGSSVINKRLGKENIHLYFSKSLIPMGYAWLFPKKEIISAGWGNRLPEISNSKSEFSQFLSLDHVSRALEGAVPVLHKPHLIPVGVRSKIYDECVFAVGDAGGFVDPISGKGIPYAILSGQLAVKSYIAAEKKDNGDAMGEIYQKMLEEAFLRKLMGKKELRKRVFRDEDSLARFLDLWKDYRGSEILEKNLM